MTSTIDVGSNTAVATNNDATKDEQMAEKGRRRLVEEEGGRALDDRT